MLLYRSIGFGNFISQPTVESTEPDQKARSFAEVTRQQDAARAKQACNTVTDTQILHRSLQQIGSSPSNHATVKTHFTFVFY